MIAITNLHAPDFFLTAQQSSDVTSPAAKSDVSSASPHRCPSCNNTLSSTGVCGSCHTLVYEHALNSQYQHHHTIGLAARRGAVHPAPPRGPPRATASKQAVVPPVVVDDEVVHQVLTPSPTTANQSTEALRMSSITMYQKRSRSGSGRLCDPWSQFRAAISCCPGPRWSPPRSRAHQGRASRTVPESVIEDVRQQIEGFQHLVKAGEEDPLRRYGAITRVHVLSLMRTSGSGKFTRWYRESHHIHLRVTHQPPPDITDIEATMLFAHPRPVRARVRLCLDGAAAMGRRPRVFFFPVHRVCKTKKEEA